MPSNANVIIVYGPYNSNGIIDYKTERIEGLKSKVFAAYTFSKNLK
jgi:hypothetical protein